MPSRVCTSVPSVPIVSRLRSAVMSSVAPGWYVDPDSAERQRYWNGGSWQSETKPVEDGTPTHPNADRGLHGPSRPAVPRSIAELSIVLYTLAGLVVIAAFVIGLSLAFVSHCPPNPYNAAFGTDLSDCSSKTYPYAWSGVGVIAGGLVQAGLIAVLGRLCASVGRLTIASAKT